MDKKLLGLIILELLAFLSFDWDVLSITAVAIFTCYLFNLIKNTNNRIVFREFILTMFSLNYLFAPALMYQGLDEYQIYSMSIPKEEYFFLAIPAILLMQAGMFLIPTKIFATTLNVVDKQVKMNEGILRQWAVAGILLRFFSIGLPGELSFFIYLLSSIRFIGAFGLFALNYKRNWIYIVAVFFFEIASSLAQGMFHDSVLWLIFFGLFACTIFKPSNSIKLAAITVGVVFLFLLQLSKSDYRNKTWEGGEEAGFATFQSSLESSTNTSGSLFSKDRVAASLTRVNQAWIFASTVQNMNQIQDFQKFNLVYKYLEAALLPRFLAPDKLKAGQQEIFNTYSGKVLGVGTSMALGILADGYVSFGTVGVYSFAFCFGFIFCLIFKTVENWTKVSPFFLFFMFPILHYAVRPDCETQTVLGHIVKGLFLYGCLVYYYKRYFIKQIKLINRRNKLNYQVQA